jgi:SAM-dependent methyltransferase
VLLRRQYRQFASVNRAVRLFRLFLRESTQPGLFYAALAHDSVRQLQLFATLADKTVLDVGGGPGFFGRAFREAGARYIGVELQVPTDHIPETFAVSASGTELPILSNTIDIVYCSNVFEHVADPWSMAQEMIRVARPGAVVYISFTPWFSPWGGHETAPWHFLGGEYARARYRRTHSADPKNVFGETLFPHRVGELLAWVRSQSDVVLVAAFPRYHPWWAAWLAKVPVLREIALWNLVVVLRRR